MEKLHNIASERSNEDNSNNDNKRKFMIYEWQSLEFFRIAYNEIDNEERFECVICLKSIRLPIVWIQINKN